MYHDVTKCRACDFGSWDRQGKAGESPEKLVPVLDLGVQPLANDFRQTGQEKSGYAPLKVLYCPRCSLAQLSVVVRPEVLYSNYAYVTSNSRTMRDHFGTLTRDILTEITAGPAIEIGSNDGLFLAYLSDLGFGNLVGIDPAKNLAERANKLGITTINDFFNPDSAEAARTSCGEPSLIIARHVFCHVHDWHGFVNNLNAMAGKNTLICLEVPYAVDQLAAGSFDQVYHEHLSYLSIKAMKALLNDTVFHLHRICHYPVHGGAIVIMIRRNDAKEPPHPSVEQYLEKEDCSEKRWLDFAGNAHKQIANLREMVEELAFKGRRICGYGASAKATVWISACEFTRKQIGIVCDSTAQKVGCTIPGTDIPVTNEGDHFTGCFDYVVLFAWNYAREIMEREKGFNHGGFSWIVPVPKLEMITA